MKFAIGKQREQNWSSANLNSFLGFLQTNTFVFNDKADQAKIMKYLMIAENMVDGYFLTGTSLSLNKPVSKSNNFAFITSVNNGSPIIENGDSFVYIDLDISKIPNDDTDWLRYFSDMLFDICSYDGFDSEDDFRKGLIFVKKSASGLGLHLLYRIKSTTIKEDIKGYGINIFKRLVEQTGFDLWYKGVFDTTSFDDKRKMWCGFQSPENIWFSEKKVQLELSRQEIQLALNFFGSRGPKYKNPPVVKQPLSNLWNFAGCKGINSTYVTGNHQSIFSFCGMCSSNGYEENEVIDFLEKEHSDIVDSSTPYNGGETTRLKVKRLWLHTKNFKAISFKDKDTLFIGAEINKELLFQKLLNGNLKLVKLTDTLERKRDFYELEDGILYKANFDKVSTITDTDWYRTFVKENAIATETDKSKILQPIDGFLFKTGEFNIIEKNMLINDDLETSYLYLDNGILEIKKDSVKLLDSSNSLYLDDWICRENLGGKRGDKIKYDNSLNLEDWKELEFFRTCTDSTDVFLRAIGYLCHRTKTNNKTIVFIDGFENDENDVTGGGGGTGKTLVSYILKSFRNVCEIGSPDPKNRFWLDSLNSNHDILLLNEVPSEFDMTVIRNFEEKVIKKEEKGKPIENLVGDNCPRILMNTNFSILKTDNATLRRIIGIPFNKNWANDHTKGENKMVREFGHEWMNSKHNSEWWSYFLLFIVDCIQKYLNNKTLISPLTQDMINEKVANTMQNSDIYSPYYDLIWQEIAKGGNVSINTMIMDIKQSHNVNLNINKTTSYLNGKVATHSRETKEEWTLESIRQGDKRYKKLTKKVIQFDSLFE